MALRVDHYRLDMEDADVLMFPALFAGGEADRLFASLTRDIAWRQDAIKLFGRVVNQPRLTAWYADDARTYTYSGITMRPEPWTPDLLLIRRAAEEAADTLFNSVLLNLYRNGRDSMSWHSDDEPELGSEPVIASVSLGATRRFRLKHKVTPTLRATVELTHGSMLLMRGRTQHCWLHCIPKTGAVCDPRINLTFRVVA